AQTMLPAPVVPSQVGASIAVGANPRDIAVSPDKNLVWVTNGTANTISVISQGTNAVAFTVVTPAGSTPGRAIYNVTASVMVVAFNGSSQIALFDAQNGSLNALFAIPNIATAVWNGVMAVQPGASGAARAYMIYDDPAV